MLYDRKMKNTTEMIFKSKNMDELKINLALLSGTQCLVARFPKDFFNMNKVTLYNGIQLHIDDASFVTIDQIQIFKSNIMFYTNVIEQIKLVSANKKEFSDCKFAINMEEDPTPLQMIFNMPEVENVNVDTRLWRYLLNIGTIEGEEDALKYYGLLPKIRIYEKDENGKRKVKKYIK